MCSRRGNYTYCSNNNIVSLSKSGVTVTLDNFDDTRKMYKITKVRLGNRPVKSFCFKNDKIISVGCTSNTRTAIYQSYPVVGTKGQLGHHCASLGRYGSENTAIVVLLCETENPELHR